MNTLLAIVFALTLHTNLREPTRLYQNSGMLTPKPPTDRVIVDLAGVKQNIPIKVEVKGNGRGDLDCYLLKRNPTPNGQGWVIAMLDESKLDQCSITYTPATDAPLRLWVTNHGNYPTNYTAVVDQ